MTSKLNKCEYICGKRARNKSIFHEPSVFPFFSVMELSRSIGAAGFSCKVSRSLSYWHLHIYMFSWNKYWTHFISNSEECSIWESWQITTRIHEQTLFLFLLSLETVWPPVSPPTKPNSVWLPWGGRDRSLWKGFFLLFPPPPFLFLTHCRVQFLSKTSLLRVRIRTYLDLTYISSQTVRALDLGVSQFEKFPFLYSSTPFPPRPFHFKKPQRRRR